MKQRLAAVFSVFSLLIAPAPAFALFNANQGGTGQVFFTAGSLLYGNGTNPLATMAAMDRAALEEPQEQLATEPTLRREPAEEVPALEVLVLPEAMEWE